MRAERNDMDYEVYLTTDELRGLTCQELGISDPTNKLICKDEQREYSMPVQKSPTGETLFIRAYDPHVGETLPHPNFDGISFQRGDNTIKIGVVEDVLFTVEERTFAVTRYDGSNKVWIRLEASSKQDAETSSA